MGLFCHLRSGGLSKMLTLTGDRNLRLSMAAPVIATLPLEKALIPFSPVHTLPYLSRLGLLSAPSRRDLDFQRLSLFRAPRPNHCRPGLGSHRPQAPPAPSRPVGQCGPSFSPAPASVLTRLPPLAPPMNSELWRPVPPQHLCSGTCVPDLCCLLSPGPGHRP